MGRRIFFFDVLFNNILELLGNMLAAQRQGLLAVDEQHRGEAELAETLYSHNHERDTNAIEVLVQPLRRKIGKDYVEKVLKAVDY